MPKISKKEQKRRQALDACLETDATIWHATSSSARLERESDPAFHEPSALLSRQLGAALMRYDAKESRQKLPNKTQGLTERLAQYSKEALELIEAEREEVEMPKDYPSSVRRRLAAWLGRAMTNEQELLAGVHAHISRYYDSIKCMEQSETDSPLPDMRGSFAPSAVVALAILLQENVRYQLASAPKRKPESEEVIQKAQKRVRKLDKAMKRERKEA